ncbi:metallophosphoesterase [Aquabacterium sp. CECT 9606]|uniref:metallophosphoesterase family protein n=1 Tax=Aquabacterium sp. CECT 9606 TaxID=2845822 RepID=UPI001E3E2523|nr:metallophosphoesterase [Aquabacterium sp. CECT 9606]CAH0350234.1 3',5'-cyclic adenosine monophosphate phosphodiesterase CpdA [Aquabacterium sp. CECT 9606]
MRRLRILHISDLHERAEFSGMPASRADTIKWDQRQRGILLGESFRSALAAIAENGIDLVCFTGDLADWGQSSEYEKATQRIDGILKLVSVPRSRFFAVPGNHDVRRDISKDAWLAMRVWLEKTHDVSNLGRWVMGPKGPPYGTHQDWIPEVMRRTESFWTWLAQFRGDDLRAISNEKLGYRFEIAAGTLEGVDKHIHIVGLDSAWLCGAEVEHENVVLKDQGSIIVTNEQVDAHTRDGEHVLDGYRIALVHHPLEHLADNIAIRQSLGDNGVDILLHGHQHMPTSLQIREPGSNLRILAAGCLVEGDLGREWPNGFQVLDIDPLTRSGSIMFQKWSSTGRFWAKGSDIYREAPDGVLAFDDGQTSSNPTILKAEKRVPSERFSALAVEHGANKIVHLAFSTYGYAAVGDSSVSVCGSLCLTTDDPDRLVRVLGQMRSEIAAAPLVPAAIKEQLSKATFSEIFEMPVARVAALRLLETMSFSAYFYYCCKSDFDAMSAETRRESMLITPLVHRLSTRNLEIRGVNSRVPELADILATARQRIVELYDREPILSAKEASKYASLEELASFVVSSACNHLSSSGNAGVAEIFESLRTRIRYAEDVSSGEQHLRDSNPLP